MHYLILLVAMLLAGPALGGSAWPADKVLFDDTETAQEKHDTRLCAHLVADDYTGVDAMTLGVLGALVETPTGEITERYDPLTAWATGTADRLEWCYTSPDGTSDKFVLTADVTYSVTTATAGFIFWGKRPGATVNWSYQIGAKWKWETTTAVETVTYRAVVYAEVDDGDCIGVLIGTPVGSAGSIVGSHIEARQLDCRNSD